MAQAASANVTEIKTRRTRGPRKVKPQTFTVIQKADKSYALNLSINGGKGMSLPMPLETIKDTVWSALEDGALITLQMIKPE